MKIDVTASLPHYLDHMAPIFDALPDRLKGTMFDVGHPCRPPDRGHIGMVAGWQDASALRFRYQLIYVEHGAGQAYLGDEKTASLPAYSGGRARHGRNIIGYVAPNVTVAERWAPASAVAAGCPKMDRWVGVAPAVDNSVCFAWHWDAGANSFCPEMRSAFEHYESSLADIVAAWTAAGVTVFGHAHPRWEGRLDRRLADLGLCVLERDADVFANVAHLFVDNSSLGYEMALIGRPVTWLNAPWYRRDVEHGLRFWSHIPGVQVDDPEELLESTPAHLALTDVWVSKVMADVYSPWSHVGLAADRAAEWITQLVDERYG